MLDKDMRGRTLTTEEECQIVRRRFGSEHGDPCERKGVLTCAMWQCQVAGECQWTHLKNG